MCTKEFYAYHPICATPPRAASSTATNTCVASPDAEVSDPRGMDNDNVNCYTSGLLALTTCMFQDTEFDRTSSQPD